MKTRPYDPLNYENIAKSVVDSLLARPPGVLPPDRKLKGAGVYSIYYTGDFELYRYIATPRFDVPIYVGSALPEGGRKGSDLIGKGEASDALYKRLVEHASSIKAAKNLRIGDFRCRYLVVLPVWIRLAESLLIDRYRPVWNLHLDGFGNHPPGKGRRDMARPAWDIVHPGRAWAAALRADKTADEIIREVREKIGLKRD